MGFCWDMLGLGRCGRCRALVQGGRDACIFAERRYPKVAFRDTLQRPGTRARDRGQQQQRSDLRPLAFVRKGVGVGHPVATSSGKSNEQYDALLSVRVLFRFSSLEASSNNDLPRPGLSPRSIFRRIIV